MRTTLSRSAGAAVCALVSSWPLSALANTDVTGAASQAHGDPLALPLLGLALILVGAKLGGHLAVRLGQASVLGELLAGVLLGNLDLAGVSQLEWIASDSVIDIFARLGVILLLFEVGLESTVAQMLRTGWSALLVAVLGVITPFALGWGVGILLIPDSGTLAHVFLGATLTATSVGITARVLKDLDRAQTPEARIILGAAVIDDVLGLVILAVVSGVIGAASRGSALSAWEIARTLFSSFGFLVGSLVLGLWLSPRLFRVAFRLRSQGVLLSLSLAFCFALSFAANLIGLAPIVGAFAAGLILERVHYTDFVTRDEHELEALLHPITSFLVPVFFVIMGMRTDLGAFMAPGVLMLALAITAVAIVGKLVCSFGVLGGIADRLTVGLGMIPRGEVGLIFANIGLGLHVGGEPVVSKHEFSALVVMVILTTMVTPPLLKWSLSRSTPGSERNRVPSAE
ncbi:MAG: Na+/H+ antiporter [Myxococcaceae bacterium]|nr:Na+/H+ antiporter [Myxococcaceae bacterium]